MGTHVFDRKFSAAFGANEKAINENDLRADVKTAMA